MSGSKSTDISESTPLLSNRNLASRATSPSPHPKPYSSLQLPVFGLIHKIRADVVSLIDTPLSEKQLIGVKVTTDLIEPLEKNYLALGNVATVYALLVNRVHFLSYQSSMSGNSVNHTRADVCEILAARVLRASFPPKHVPRSVRNIRNTPPDDDDTTYRLAKVLCANFSPFQGAPEHVLKRAGDADGKKKVIPTGNALEMAIISEAKQFIRSAACQKTVEDMWNGRIMYTPSAFYDFLPDHYKRKEIMLYKPGKSPILDQYRLLVPKYRARLEYGHFMILFISYFLCLWTFDPTRHHMNGYEIWFLIFALGFSLDKFATGLAHGYTVYMHSLWNGLDAVFVNIFLFYVVLRLYGLKKREEYYRDQAFDVLTSAAVVLFPRFAFVSLADNVLVLSLRALMSSFVFLMFLATWCFTGFATAFYLLGRGAYSFAFITKLMLWLWFGLDGTGIHIAREFHPILGPVLWVAYACLSSTLVLTVLVSMLSHTFAEVNEDAIAEDMYRRAVNTFEGNKSDALFLFQPPFNILALFILWPLGYFCNARWYHKITVFFARLFNAPLLLSITYASRLRAYRKLALHRLNGNLSDSTGSLKKKKSKLLPKGLLSFVNAHQDIEAAFDVELASNEWEEIFKVVADIKSYHGGHGRGQGGVGGLEQGHRSEASDDTITLRSANANASAQLEQGTARPKVLFREDSQTSITGEEKARRPLPVASIFRRGWWSSPFDESEDGSVFGGSDASVNSGKRRVKRGQTMIETSKPNVVQFEEQIRKEWDARFKSIEDSNKRIEEALAKLIEFDPQS